MCGWYLTRYNDKNLTWERERGGINEKSCNVGLCGWYLTRHNNSFHHERERERERGWGCNVGLGGWHLTYNNFQWFLKVAFAARIQPLWKCPFSYSKSHFLFAASRLFLVFSWYFSPIHSHPEFAMLGNIHIYKID